MVKKNSKTLSTKEYAIITGLPVATITKMLRSGQIIGEKCSGKWRISQNQVSLKTATPPKTKTSASVIKKTTEVKNFYKSDYSVGEFCKITYLTEFGILTWLKNGKIKGHRDDHGNWRIDAESLSLPNLKHLLRD